MRKVNASRKEAVVPDVLQVRMYLYGLTPMLTPLVATANPNTLEEVIERAKVMETGYNYVSTKQASFQTIAATKENPTLAELSKPVVPAEVDSLADQLQKLTLNYANLTTALLAQDKKEQPERQNYSDRPRNADRKDNAGRKGPIICFKYGKEGHIAQNCYSKLPNSRPSSTSQGNRSFHPTNRN